MTATNQTDTFDVSPKEYAQGAHKSKISAKTARIMFKRMHANSTVSSYTGACIIMRGGDKTELFPDGKLLFMSRAHYNAVLANKGDAVPA